MIHSFGRKERKRRSVSSLWHKLASLDPFTKTAITALLLLLLIAPFFVANQQLFKQEAATTASWQEISPPQVSHALTVNGNANYGFTYVIVDPQHPSTIY